MEKTFLIITFILILVLLAAVIFIALYLTKIKNSNKQSNIQFDFQQLNSKFASLDVILNDTKTKYEDISNKFAIFKQQMEDIKSYLDEKLKKWLGENKDESISKINEANSRTNNSLNDNFKELRKEIDDKIKSMIESSEKQLQTLKNSIDTYFESELQTKLKEHFEEMDKTMKDLNTVLITSSTDQNSMKEQMTNLTKIMSGSKTRGNFGEIMLENILQNNIVNEFLFTQINMGALAEKINIEFPKLSKSSKVSKSNIVDCAILFKNKFIIIDSKFPMADYERYIKAKDNTESENELKNLINRVKAMAKDISEKYICEPLTVEYAYMYIPSVSLYSTILSNNIEITKEIWDKYNIIMVDPTNLLPSIKNIFNDIERYEISKNANKIQDLLSDVYKGYSLTLSELERSKRSVDNASELLDGSVKRIKRINNKLASSKLIELKEYDDDNTSINKIESK